MKEILQDKQVNKVISEDEKREKERREVLCGERSIYDTPLLDKYEKLNK